MGTPTPRANSGTEEEFDCAIEAILNGQLVQLLLFFSDVPIHPHSLDPHQLLLVRAFREKAARLGVLYHTYSDMEQLRQLVRISLQEAHQTLSDGLSTTKYSPSKELLSKGAHAQTIKFPDRAFRAPTKAPQWADSFLIPLAEFRRQHVRLTWTMTTNSEYFRFGFKYYDSREPLYSAGSIQTMGQNILFHVGKNIGNPGWFTTFYRSGLRHATNEPLDNGRARTSACFELDISAEDIVTFSLDGQRLSEMFFPIDGLPVLAILAWGDENHFLCDLSDLTLHVNPEFGDHS